MSKTPVGLDVAVVGAVVGVVLGAVVMGKLKDAFAVCEVRTRGSSRGAVVCEKVEGEFVFGEVDLFDKAEAEVVVEFDLGKLWLTSAGARNCLRQGGRGRLAYLRRWGL